MDELTKILVQSIIARNELAEHRCSVSWCPHYDIGCKAARRLAAKDREAFQRALEAIEVRLKYDNELEDVREPQSND